jgi:hypothetical protein
VKLWLDDKRPAPEGWTHAHTAREAMRLLAREHVEEASLDHDLGHCDGCVGCKGYQSACGCECHQTGYSVALFMASTGRWPDKQPTCHSANPAGKANIESVIRRYFGKRIEYSVGEFRLSWKETEASDAFVRRHEKKHGRCQAAAGGRFSFRFTPTGWGLVSSISCASCRKKKTLTDFGDW